MAEPDIHSAGAISIHYVRAMVGALKYQNQLKRSLIALICADSVQIYE
jgi:hypothetical protein